MSDRLDTRTSILLGDEGIEKLRNASVILCGCGAVGGYVLEGMVRAGIGRIRVVDGDVFSGSNLNRQIRARARPIGRRTAQAARDRPRAMSPDVGIGRLELLVSVETIPEILSGGFDILVDAIDTVGHKTELLRHACDMGIRTFSSMGAALHMDTQKVRVAPIMKTHTCPMAAIVRKGLRGHDTSNITAVFSEEPPIAKPKDRDDYGKSVLGSLPTVPAVFGMTLANLVIGEIISKD